MYLKSKQIKFMHGSGRGAEAQSTPHTRTPDPPLDHHTFCPFSSPIDNVDADWLNALSHFRIC